MIRMACWVTILAAALRLTALPKALKFVSTPVRLGKSLGKAAPAKLAHAIDLLLGMDLLLFRPSCWKRAVILHRYPALNGIESRIKFGVRKESGNKLAGHGWLEHQGETLLEVTKPAYTVTFTFPAEAADINQPGLLPKILQY